MSTNHTPNYQLSQWEKTDKIQMDDFNADNAKLDAALADQAGTLAAHTAALGKLGNCQIGHFTYTGNYQYGEDALVINFPHPPLFFFVLGQEGFAAGSCLYDRFIAALSTSPYASVARFPLKWQGTSANVTIYETDEMNNGTVYHVIYFYAKD